MKVKEGFIMREVAGMTVVLAVGNAAEKFKGTITLNESGTLLWKKLETGCSKKDLLDEMLDNYDIDETTAKNDIDTFLKKLIDNGIIDNA